MKEVQNTEIFRLLDAKSNIRLKCQENFKNMVNCNTMLEDTFKSVGKIYKDPLTMKAIKDAQDGNIIFYYVETTDKLPVWYPFIKFRQNNIPKIAVNITDYQSHSTNNVTEEVEVKIEPKKLYSFLISAYLYRNFFYNVNPNIPPVSPELAKNLSDIWARLFCKILNTSVGLSTNKERYDAFMYFAQKFFLINILEMPETTANDISVSQFMNKRVNPTAAAITDACSNKDINMYENIITFCNTLFNPEITGLRGMRLKSSSDGMTFDMFMRSWIKMYHLQAGLALESFPHFMWMILSANAYSFIFSDAAIEKECTTLYPRIMSNFYMML